MSKKEINLKTILKSDFDDLKAGVSFEKGLELLEELVSQVEEGELPLEESIKAYETGAKLIAHLKDLLGDAEEKLEILKVADSK